MVPVRTQFPGPQTVGPGSDFWNQTYDIDGRPVTLSQISSALNQSRPHYFWGGDLVCYDANMACCPAYCCNVMSTVHDLQKPMDMSFRDYQTASLNGTFQVLSWGESPLPEGQGGGQGGRDDKGSGAFVGILFKTFEFPIYGGWTLEIHFNKPVFDLRSFNARIVGTGDGAKTYFMQPEYWNKNIPTGTRRILVQGLTTPIGKDGIPLTADGALWYNPKSHSPLPPRYLPPSLPPSLPTSLRPGPYKPEPRPVPPPPATAGEKYNLAEVLQLSSLFYEAQRSGKLPPSQRVRWRKDACMDDGQDVGEDLAGGYFDAGDYIQFTVPMAYSMTVLLWGLIRYEDAYVAAGELGHMRDTVKWGLDWLLKTHTDRNELYVQIADEVDHCRWGPPETINYLRRSYKVTCLNPGSQPGTRGREGGREGGREDSRRVLVTRSQYAPSSCFKSVRKSRLWSQVLFSSFLLPSFPTSVMNTASAMAAGAIAFRNHDPAYAATLLQHAEELFAFADMCPGDWIRNGTIPAGNFYNDGGRYLDEHAFAAAWLHKATGKKEYLDKAIATFYQCCYVPGGYQVSVLDWADMTMGINLLLYEATQWNDFKDAVINRQKAFMNKIPRTPKGLSYYNEWGPNRYAANAAFTALVAAEFGFEVDYFRSYAASQINYMLGDCCGGKKSFLIGFGPSWPNSYHHRAASCKGTDCRCTQQDFPHILWGGLLGGPEKDDTISDEGCPDFIHMEVALDFSAGFTTAVAGLKHLSLRGIRY
ncbi:hypothetical protein NSK_003427 [Nannochloropsis salina CCMP1776]|uniref:cellulase n=1 Tax=Nannochloropsis salina CCMP1776 TaxID=1027361 RepID=A0A4D9D4Q3_9STRA|nr:hypothetical protein NSK_003427 [Nannochloropsis salina CCMP1776]|eukprot:TFJ85003.1 hypothetical protein NSK_003427 [Nannochloropsis salina CCMP1776]